MARVCVVIPAYNAVATLARTVASACAQSHGDLEIFIVDDGSTDGTLDMARGFAAADPRISVLHQANAGVAAARNNALARTDCALTTWLDADDLWHPEKIARQLAVYEAAREKPSLVYTGYRLIDADDRIIANFRTLADVSGHTICRQIATNFFSNVSSIMVPTALARRFGGHDPRLREWGIEGAEDLLLQLQLATVGPLACCNQALVGYRMHRHNMSLSHRRAARSNARALELVAEMAPDLPGWVFRMGHARTVGYALHLARSGDLPGALSLIRDLAMRQPGYTGLMLALILGSTIGRATGLVSLTDPDLGRPFLDAAPERAPWHGHMLITPWHLRALRKADRAWAARRFPGTAGGRDAAGTGHGSAVYTNLDLATGGKELHG